MVLSKLQQYCPRCGRATTSTLPTGPTQRCRRCHHDNPCFAARCGSCGHDRLSARSPFVSPVVASLRSAIRWTSGHARRSIQSFNRIWLALGLYLAPIIAHLLLQIQRAEQSSTIKHDWLWIPAANWISLFRAHDFQQGPHDDRAPLLAALCVAFLVLWTGTGFIVRYHIRKSRRSPRT
jgi:hypothetical protein